MAYLPYWVATSTDAPYDPATDPYIVDGRLTDIVLFSVGVRRNGSLKLDTPGAAFVLSPRAAAIIDRGARSGHPRPRLVHVGRLQEQCRLFGDQRAMDRFVAEATALVQARGLDGADMDIEHIDGDWFDAYATTAGALKDSLDRARPGGTRDGGHERRPLRCAHGQACHPGRRGPGVPDGLRISRPDQQPGGLDLATRPCG